MRNLSFFHFNVVLSDSHKNAIPIVPLFATFSK